MHLAEGTPDLGTRVNEAIAQVLVVAFGVIVFQEPANGPAQSCFAEKDQAVKTLSLERGIISLHSAQALFVVPTVFVLVA
jgi:hypothetical protein